MLRSGVRFRQDRFAVLGKKLGWQTWLDGPAASDLLRARHVEECLQRHVASATTQLPVIAEGDIWATQAEFAILVFF